MAFFRGYADKKYKGLIQGGRGAFGNAAARIEAFVAGGGTYAHGSYADIDGLFREQATEPDPKRREATLHRIQQLIHEKVMFAAIWLHAGLSGVGPRVEEPGIGLIDGSVRYKTRDDGQARNQREDHGGDRDCAGIHVDEHCEADEKQQHREHKRA